MEGIYYRVKPHIMMLDQSNISPAKEKPFFIIDNYNGLLHLGGKDDGYILSYLVRTKNYVQLLKHCESSSSLFEQFSEKLVKEKLQHFIDKDIIEKSNEPFRNMDNHAILSIGGEIKSIDKTVNTQAFPWTIALALTLNCNLKCKHCLVARGKHLSKLPELKLNEIVTLFEELEKNSLGELRIAGGEPFQYPGVMEVIEEAAKRRFKLILFTNCFALNSRIIEKLKRIQEKKNKGFKLHYSIDGSSAITHDWFRGRKGAFEKLCDSLAELNNAGIRMVAESTLHRRNLYQIREICDIAAKYGTMAIDFHPSYYMGRAIKNYVRSLLLTPQELIEINDVIWECQLHYEEKMNINFSLPDLPPNAFLSDNIQRRHALLTLKEQCLDKSQLFRCSAGTSQMYISSDGTVYPCPNFEGMFPFAMGNVKSESSREIWLNKDKWKFFRGGWQYSDLPICKFCRYNLSCKLAQCCRALPAAAFDDPYGPSPVCCIYKNKFNLNVPDMGKYIVGIER